MNPMIKIRIDLLRKQPFFGRLALLLQILPTTRIYGSSTDGEHLYYNPDWFKTQTKEQREGVVLHEILHVSLGHLWRKAQRNEHIWNLACDYVVNNLVTKNGYPLYTAALYNGAYNDKNAEQVYEILMKDAKEQPQCGFIAMEDPPSGGEGDQQEQGEGDKEDEKKDSKDKDGKGKGKGEGEEKQDNKEEGSGGGKGKHNHDKSKGKGDKGEGQDDGKDSEDDDGEGKDNKDGEKEKKDNGDGQNKPKNEKKNNEPQPGCPSCISHQFWNKAKANPKKLKKLKKRWEAAVENLVKERGLVPAGFEELVEELKPKEDWKKILVNYLSQSVSDFDWMRRDRRSLSGPFYFPDLHNEMLLENIVIALDTSGSISSLELNQFLAEVKEILRSFPKSKGWVIDCDSEVGSVIELAKAKDKKTFYGRGGTSHKPVFKEITKRKIRPKVVLCFTDLYTDFPTTTPNYPVLWLVHHSNLNPNKVPFGRVIKLREGFRS